MTLTIADSHVNMAARLLELCRNATMITYIRHVRQVKEPYTSDELILIGVFKLRVMVKCVRLDITFS